MARRYRLWVEKDGNGQALTCGMTALTAPKERSIPSQWEGQPEVDGFPFGGSWALLLALLDLERYIQPEEWLVNPTEGRLEELTANEDIPRPDWPSWKEFAARADAPYLATSDQDHPLVWFPGTDGEWYGFLLDTGVMQGRTHWWVPGMERLETDPTTGEQYMVMSPIHEERPGSKTLREVLSSAPQGLFDVNDRTRLTLREVLEEVFAEYTQEEIARFRFYVYKSDPGHKLLFETRSIVENETGRRAGYALPSSPNVFFMDTQYEPYAFETIEAMRECISALAWTWLSPLARRWSPVLRTDFGIEFGHDPNVTQVETAKRLASLSPRQKFALTCTGVGGRPGGGDPLQGLLSKVRAERELVPGSAQRVVPSLLEKAKDEFWSGSPTDEAKNERKKQTSAARRQLAGSARIREVFTTTDLFAAAAWQLEWAVEAVKVLLSCPHPGCGRAFFREHPAERFCPQHRDTASRKRRSTLRKRRNE